MRLKSDYNLVVIDARRGIGNGHVIPGGPLRAPLLPQISLASAILRLGEGEAADSIVRTAARAGKPIHVANTVPSRKMDLKGKRVCAFAGIADPEKFYASLVAAGATIVLSRNWPDHHFFDDDELSELLKTAESGELALVTTEKDAMRLLRGSAVARQVLERTLVFKIEVRFDQPDAPEYIIGQTLDNFPASDHCRHLIRLKPGCEGRIGFNFTLHGCFRINIGFLPCHAPIPQLVQRYVLAGNGADNIGAWGNDLKIMVKVAQSRFA